MQPDEPTAAAESAAAAAKEPVPAPDQAPAPSPGDAPAATAPDATEPEAEGAQGAAPAPEDMPKPVVKVLVVDDELAGLTAAHLREFAADFVAELADINGPTTEAVWAVVSEITGQPPFAQAAPETVAAFLVSDDFVPVVLSAQMRAAVLPIPGQLTPFFDHADSVNALRTLLETAFAAPAFELTIQATRPAAPGALMAFDLIVLDLVLANSAAAVDELVTYLTALARDEAPLPCLIVLSSREEMLENRPRFSTESQISAAGLLLLEKRLVRQPAFGVVGLQLSYEQLSRQRQVAQHTRMFVRAWIDGLEQARTAASQTLWNLDAAAMQEIHLSANSDDDPYDAHLNELVAREYLWHVEGVEAVANAVDALDAAFQTHLKSEGKKVTIVERFVAPYADPKPGRNLVSHYNWAGFKSTGRLDALSADDLARKFNRLVPFGAVLAPEALAVGAQCWVHITQQCDLNSAVRVDDSAAIPDGTVSAMFAVATAIAVSDRRLPAHNSRDLVARGLRVGTQEFDLKLVNGRTIAMPIKQLINTVRAERCQIVGRLRHDIATQFLNATANHMTRPAQLKATRVEMRPARLYLWGKGFNGDQPLAFTNGDGEPRTMQVGANEKLVYFADEASLHVALWIAEEARTKLAQTDVDTSRIFNLVRGGIADKGHVVHVINLDIKPGRFDQIDAILGGEPPRKPTLVMFMETDPEE